jgi:hypothetical protein
MEAWLDGIMVSTIPKEDCGSLLVISKYFDFHKAVCVSRYKHYSTSLPVATLKVYLKEK